MQLYCSCTSVFKKMNSYTGITTDFILLILSTFSFAGITVFLLINYKGFCIFFGKFFFSWHFPTLITSPIFNVPDPPFLLAAAMPSSTEACLWIKILKTFRSYSCYSPSITCIYIKKTTFFLSDIWVLLKHECINLLLSQFVLVQ